MDARAYYNEIDPYAAQWLRNLMAAGHIPDGDVDERSITDVQPMDLKGYAQCHFFAGIAGWSHALRLAGWPDDRPVWTGSCPCQPFSVAGKGRGKDDERHLWPHFFRLIRACRPTVVMGEQVAGKAGYGWFDGVRSNLEGESYTSRAVDIPACAVNAPHISLRLYWVATNMGNASRSGLSGDNRRRTRTQFTDGHASGDMAHTNNARPQGHGRPFGEHDTPRWQIQNGYCSSNSFWRDAEWLTGADGKTRRAKPRVRLLAHGVPARVGRLRAYGNAIVPPLAAEVIKCLI